MNNFEDQFESRTMVAAPPHHTAAEQSVIGALLRDNDAVDRIADLRAEHFYTPEHAVIYREIMRQIGAGKRCDVITTMEALGGRVSNAGAYLNEMAQATPSAANVKRYADIVIDRAMKRGLQKVAGDLAAWSTENTPADQIADRAASRIEALAQRDTNEDPFEMVDLLTEHAELMEKRLDKDDSVRPVATGWGDLDRQLGGGLERGTLTIAAGRPAMGKTAFGLGAARNVAENGGVSALLSMEMPRKQIMDRNISGIGKIPLAWLKEPTDDAENWSRLTYAYQKAREMPLFIDDKTALNMLQIRAKARFVKRKKGGLDLLVIDQLSFITGSENDNYAYALGEYTRGLVALAKDLDCAILLLCQLSRRCEDRPNKRPMCSDLASSGNIEQDGATVIFLYRDEVYNPDSPDNGIAEIIIGKARQGATGTVALTYIGEQTRFETLARGWSPAKAAEKKRGLAKDL